MRHNAQQDTINRIRDRRRASLLLQDRMQQLVPFQRHNVQRELSQRMKVKAFAHLHLLDRMYPVRVQHHRRSAQREHSPVQASRRALPLQPVRSLQAQVQRTQRFAQPVTTSRRQDRRRALRPLQALMQQDRAQSRRLFALSDHLAQARRNHHVPSLHQGGMSLASVQRARRFVRLDIISQVQVSRHALRLQLVSM